MKGFAALLLWTVALAGCWRSTIQVKKDEDVQMGQYKRVAVVAFVDERGQGRAIAEDIAGQLQRIGHRIVDAAVVESILKQHKLGEDMTLGLETMELLRSKTSVDALIVGRMMSDWSSASITVVETELGDPVIRAVIRPRERGRKAFKTRDEIVLQAMAALIGKK